MKLLESARKNYFQSVLSSGFLYLEKDMNVQDKSKNTALFYAVNNKNTEFVKWLIEKGAKPNVVCEHGNTPVH